MIKKYKIYIIIILAVSSILLIKKDAKKSTIDGAIIAVLNQSDIAKIFMADRQGQTITLTKNKDNWIINNKYQVRKDAITVLLNTISEIRVKRTVPLIHEENIIKELAALGVKIEIYDESKLMKSYTIGNTTEDYLGTYMLLDHHERPFITHIPSHNGFLGPRYGISVNAINVNNWRDINIFQLNKNEINNISIKHFRESKSSFFLNVDSLRLFDVNNKIIELDTLLMKKYLNIFRDLNCEAFKNEKTQIEGVSPIHELIVNNDTLHTYPIDFDGVKTKDENFNVRRMYATLNNGDLMLIQTNVFNKVLITINELKK